MRDDKTTILLLTDASERKGKDSNENVLENREGKGENEQKKRSVHWKRITPLLKVGG